MNLVKKTILISLLITSPLFVLALGEASLRLWNAFKNDHQGTQNEKVELKDIDESHYEIFHQKTRNGVIEWRSKALIDSRTGLRVKELGSTQLERDDKVLTLLGGSFTYGSNLNYEDTLSGLFEKKLRDYRILNMGLAGMGPHQLIKKLKELKNDFNNTSSGEIFYFLITDHMGRMVVDSAHIGDFSELIHYDVLNSKAIDGEVFKKKYPFYTRFLKFVRSSRLLNWLGVNIPLGPYDDLSKGAIDKMCSVIHALKNEALSVFKRSRFRVVILPGQPEASHQLGNCFADGEVIDLQHLIKDRSYHNEKYYFSDGHPKAIYNELVVKALLEEIK